MANRSEGVDGGGAAADAPIAGIRNDQELAIIRQHACRSPAFDFAAIKRTLSLRRCRDDDCVPGSQYEYSNYFEAMYQSIVLRRPT
jgi:hypothetical protein